MFYVPKDSHLKILLVSSLALPVLLLVFVNFYFAGKVLNNVFVMGEDVSGMASEDLERLVVEKSDNFFKRDIVFRILGASGSHDVAVPASSLGISFDPEETAKRAYKIGRSGNTFLDLRVKIRSFFAKDYIYPVTNIDFSTFSNTLDQVSENDTKETKDASIVFDRDVRIEEAQDGLIVDKTRSVQDLRDRIRDFSFEAVTVPVIYDQARVKAGGADIALARVKKLNNQRIVLTFGFNSWKISGKTLISILRFYPKGMERGYALKFELGDQSLVVLNSSNNSADELEVSVDDNYITQFVEDIADSVDQEKVDATLVFEGGKVKEFTPAQDGQKLDQDVTFNLIKNAVSVDNLSSERELSINLPVRVVPAKIANDEINSLGIRELIGKGVSYFAGSIANRVYNISLGASRINGTLVKSGEVFSFNKAVGEVSGSTGYKQAYVISSGRTVLDDGGGICQVSTTVFRAALNAGLPIVARTAHAYRVGYYEQRGFKAGLDATVWAPAVDFAFKNDTDHSILVQTVFDGSSAKLEVSIYGTGDGRKVQITDPVISNIQPAPPDEFQDDPTLPKGTKKQVDFSAQGATSVFGRKVYKGDKLIIDESFKSVYRPWRAVYLVGTGG